jgi:hypothetical protein
LLLLLLLYGALLLFCRSLLLSLRLFFGALLLFGSFSLLLFLILLGAGRHAYASQQQCAD